MRGDFGGALYRSLQRWIFLCCLTLCCLCCFVLFSFCCSYSVCCFPCVVCVVCVVPFRGRFVAGIGCDVLGNMGVMFSCEVLEPPEIALTSTSPVRFLQMERPQSQKNKTTQPHNQKQHTLTSGRFVAGSWPVRGRFWL